MICLGVGRIKLDYAREGVSKNGKPYLDYEIETVAKFPRGIKCRSYGELQYEVSKSLRGTIYSVEGEVSVEFKEAQNGKKYPNMFIMVKKLTPIEGAPIIDRQVQPSEQWSQQEQSLSKAQMVTDDIPF